jgi:hypothetical protein
MFPVAVPVPLVGVTVPEIARAEPCTAVVGEIENVVVVGLKETVFQLFSRFVTFSDPKPVAKS